MSSAIFKCRNVNCLNFYQDKEHGTFNRVFNSTQSTDKWRCSVCNVEQIFPGTNIIAKSVKGGKGKK